MSNIIKLNDANFEQEVLNSDLPVLVDFWAQWCGPCKMIAVILEEVVNDYKDKLKIVKLDVEENNIITSKFNITNIPTLKIFKNGKEVATQVGNNGKTKLLEFINNNI